MEKKEAIKILIKQVKDYDAWSYCIMNSLMLKKDLCKHPYPMWFKKDDNSKECSCMICYKKLDYDKDVDITFKNFDSQEKVDEAIKVLLKEIKNEK